MKGYNAQRTNKPEKRKTQISVLSVWNGSAWTRVPNKIEFYSEYLGVVKTVEIDIHRTEFYNADGQCVMVLEK